MRCEQHDHVLYDRVWWICRHCDNYYREYRMTNAVKAGIISVINSLFGLLLAFDVPLTTVQIGASLIFANSVLGLIVLLTYKNSPKRIADA